MNRDRSIIPSASALRAKSALRQEAAHGCRQVRTPTIHLIVLRDAKSIAGVLVMLMNYKRVTDEERHHHPRATIFTHIA
jgi:hypothetical protein